MFILSEPVKKVLRPFVLNLLQVSAFIWRRLLFRTTFIAITGSVGKTTTKECIANILSAYFTVSKTLNNGNDLWGVPRTILKVMPWHRFAVIEVGTDKPGMIQKSAELIKPDIAIVLTVKRVHTFSFPAIEDIAKEKSQLLKFVPAKGFVILNAEDLNVIKMKSECIGHIKTFGITSGKDLCGESITSKWPEGLSLQVNNGKEHQLIKTNLIGEHWINSVLASLLTASLCGINIKDSAVQLEKMKPFMGRMQPVKLPSGAVLIRDEFSGSFDTLYASLKVLKDARAARRILVIGNIADSSENSRNRCRKIGVMASEVSDIAVFIGKDGRYSVRTAIEAGMKEDAVFHFTELTLAAKHISSEYGAGDVILLKARSTDHLSRILFAQFGKIDCWKTRCTKRISCDLCDELKPQFKLESIF